MEPSLLARSLAQSLDPARGDPLAHQIVEHVWTDVVQGSLDTGARMPTVRELAVELGVSPRTVRWAYDELTRLGVLSTRPGEGTFVSLAPPSDDERRRRQEFLTLCTDTVRQATALGYDVDGLIGALSEYRRARLDEADRGEIG